MLILKIYFLKNTLQKLTISHTNTTHPVIIPIQVVVLTLQNIYFRPILQKKKKS